MYLYRSARSSLHLQFRQVSSFNLAIETIGLQNDCSRRQANYHQVAIYELEESMADNKDEAAEAIEAANG